MDYVPETPAEALSTLLVDNIFKPWRIGVGQLINDPPKQIIFIDSPGQAPDPRWLLDYPSIQVLIRGDIEGYKAAHDIARAVFDTIAGCQPFTRPNGDRWDGVLPMGSPAYIGTDANNCPLFSSNFRAYLEPAQSSQTKRVPLGS